MQSKAKRSKAKQIKSMQSKTIQSNIFPVSSQLEAEEAIIIVVRLAYVSYWHRSLVFMTITTASIFQSKETSQTNLAKFSLETQPTQHLLLNRLVSLLLF